MTEGHPYAHNLVSSLYAMKELLESFLLNRQDGDVLKRAYSQADQALKIAKRLGEILAYNETASNGQRDYQASVKRTWERLTRILDRETFLANVKILERIPEPFPLIRCHPRDFREILFHLVRNCLQAMGGNGKLVVRAHLSFSTQEEPFATIQVADTGPGIPQSRLPRLFLPFYSTKPWREGSGLGLFLTRHLVQRNCGRITVSSFSGFGTTFTLEFPIVH